MSTNQFNLKIILKLKEKLRFYSLNPSLPDFIFLPFSGHSLRQAAFFDLIIPSEIEIKNVLSKHAI